MFWIELDLPSCNFKEIAVINLDLMIVENSMLCAATCFILTALC